MGVNKKGIWANSLVEQNGNAKIYKENLTINENLVPNAYFTKDNSIYATLDKIFTFQGMPTMKISATGKTENTFGSYSQNIPNLKAGDTITVSAYIYRKPDHGIDVGCKMRLYQIHNDSSANNWSGFVPALSETRWPFNKWIKVEKTYVLDSNFKQGVLNFNNIKNGTYWLAAPKVEYGNKSTPFIPDGIDARTEQAPSFANEFYEI